MTSAFLDPIAAAERISSHYARYLRTTFQVGDADLRDEVQKALETAVGLSKGPYLQVVPPFTVGVSVRQLIAEGLLHPALANLQEEALPIDRTLYAHQERALRLAVGAGRNLLVATGTGSGKTETFLLPIIDQLLRERAAGTLGPGVRALLLYPMNVLANDQMRRIRALLAPFPELTFGRYIGATAKTREQAHALFRQHSPGEAILGNELMSRAEMQDTPPNILLTNFSMLEYLLLRTADLRLFANDPSTWQFIVLDEVHTYSGAKGTEIASLLRRVKQRVLPRERQRGTLRCMGTSATLGSERDRAELVHFASDLFGENFEWVEADRARQDVVTPERDAGRLGDATIELGEEAYGQLLELVLRKAASAEVARLVSAQCGVTVDAALSVPAQLATVLTADRRFLDIRERLVADEVVEPGALVERYFPMTGNVGLVNLISLGTRARWRPADAALLPARFHYLVRSLDGVYACLHPAHPAGRDRVRLEPHLTCPECKEEERDIGFFEIAACEACGAAYLAGVLFPDGGSMNLRTTTPSNLAREWFLLDASAATEGDEDEDEALTDGAGLSLLPDQAERWLCVGCGAVRDHEQQCSCKSPALRRVLLVKSNEDGVITQCASCRRRNGAGVVRRLAAGAGGPLSVIASDLYQSLPPVLTGEKFIPGEGRKLISFADSRQQAAEFAVFLDRTYGRAIERNLMVHAVEGLQESLGERPVGFAALRAAVARRAMKEGAINSADPRDAERAAAQWIIREAVTGSQRLSLEGTGLFDVSVRMPAPSMPKPLLDVGLDPYEAHCLLQELLATVRFAGALTLPEGIGAGEVDIPGSFVTFRSEGATRGVLAWLPSGARRNSRLDYLRRVAARLDCEVDVRQMLAGIWQFLVDPRNPVLTVEHSKRDGVVSSIPHAALEFSHGKDSPTWKCDRCRRMTHRAVRGVCPTYGCRGTLQSVPSLFDGHYAQLYSEIAPIPARIEEHTAQIEAYEATKIQNAFQEGTVNILSCSTTFELGVDVGEVQAVLMRNVPPSAANYVQRAGRAGRRSDSTALVVTFAQRRNHDRYHFENPLPMLKGIVQPPIMTLTNQTIVRRHVQSVAFAMFEHAFGRRDANVIDFFGPPIGTGGDESAYVMFRRWLEDEQDALRAALSTMLADMPGMAEAMGLDNWAWVDRLLSNDTEHLDRAWLTRAYDEFCEMDGKLEELIKEATSERAFGRANHLQRIQDTIRKRDLLGYLATYGVLPKYGFPSDVVEMRVQSEESAGNVDARRIELNRDLQIAVAEYAPGAQVVAGKQRWESVGLATRRDRALLVFNWMTCPRCEAYAESAEDVEEGFSACRSCGERVPNSKRGVFVIPSFGFIGRHVSSHVDTPRVRAGFAEFHFAHYQGQQPEVKTITVGSGGTPLDVLSSPSGKIAVLNRGRKAQGFQVCLQCGYARPASRKVRNAKGHDVPGRKGVKCKGMLRNMALGHRFITDVLEIRPSVAMPRSAALSVLHALVTGAVVLGVPDNDIGGVLRPLDSGRYGLVLYDTVPGGAGHVTSIARRLGELFAAALRRVAGCSCGIETSCYGCLRNYRNERVHDDLCRQYAIHYLETLIGAKAPTVQ